jgi:hypothetical protein
MAVRRPVPCRGFALLDTDTDGYAKSMFSEKLYQISAKIIVNQPGKLSKNEKATNTGQICNRV